MANEEKELYKFVNDPKYRSKVIAKIHKNSDNAYNKRIKKIEHERDALSKKRTREITRIANDRWESLAGGSIGVNRTEGKIQINNTTVLFSRCGNEHDDRLPCCHPGEFQNQIKETCFFRRRCSRRHAIWTAWSSSWGCWAWRNGWKDHRDYGV